MMKRLVFGGFLVAAAVGLNAGNAYAEDEKVIREADRVEFKKKTIIDFSDVTIQGELTKPEGSYLLNRKKTNFKMLLKIREDFYPELENSIDNL